jgi:hypothetical protein
MLSVWLVGPGQADSDFPTYSKGHYALSKSASISSLPHLNESSRTKPSSSPPLKLSYALPTTMNLFDFRNTRGS